MRSNWRCGFVFCFLIVLGARDTFASGEFLHLPETDPDYGCYGRAPQSATFTNQKSTYVFTGKCDLLRTRLNLRTTAPWTGTGTYEPATGRTTEDIIVPAPRLDEPSRPYGRFQAAMRCSADPWLTTKLTCDNITSTVDAPLDRTGAANTMGWRQPFPLGPLITSKISYYARPYTSILKDDARKALNAQYRSRFPKAYTPSAIYLGPSAPIIISPQPNVRITSGSFKIQMTPSKYFTGTHILVQFTKVDGPANQLKPTYAWSRTTGELANGAYLPTDIVNSNGNWTLRARIEAPKPGDFSAAVPFVYQPAPMTIQPRRNIDIYRR